MNKLLLISSLLCLIFIQQSCSHYDELMVNGKESKAGDDESHNAGKNCMSCHNVQGFSEAKQEGGWWYIAGTAYKNGRSASSKNGWVEFWTGPNRTGTFVYKLAIDDLGNFYTAKIVRFGDGFYPVLINPDNTINSYMSSKTTSGACNSCHGAGGVADKIEFK